MSDLQMQSRGQEDHAHIAYTKTKKKQLEKTKQKIFFKKSRYNFDLSIENLFLWFCFDIPFEKDAPLRFKILLS